MSPKISSGKYKCPICGEIKDSYRNYKNHKETCGIVSISQFVQGDISLKSNSFEPPETRQIKIGESPVGECPRCGTLVLESDAYNKYKDQYECRRCENIVLVK